MKAMVNSISIRLMLAGAILITFVMNPRVTRAEATPFSNLKSESQLRSEASRYDNALRAIGDVASMKLEDASEMQKALAILDRERPNLQLLRSKLITVGLSDSTFTSSAKKAAPDKAAAVALAKELSANPRAVVKINGAQGLANQLQQILQNHASTLRRTAERLKQASATYKKSSALGGQKVFTNTSAHLVLANFSPGNKDSRAFRTSEIPLQEAISDLILTALILVVAVVFYVWVIAKLISAGEECATDCQTKADRDYNACNAAAKQQIFPLNLAAEAACYSEWLATQAACGTLAAGCGVFVLLS